MITRRLCNMKNNHYLNEPRASKRGPSLKVKQSSKRAIIIVRNLMNSLKKCSVERPAEQNRAAGLFEK